VPQGSKKNERRGGRQKGTPNRLTIERRLRAQAGFAAAEQTGVMPLDIMLTVARGGEAAAGITDRQLAAAVAAAPYVHPKLAAVAVKDLTPPEPAPEKTEEQRLARARVYALLKRLENAGPLATGITDAAEEQSVQWLPDR